ncbi:MAG: hypothetical protein A2074_01450 [Candidatus Aquicultor primus]|uniref:Uncharacterized protein n=1 Tax=Candidatus Aquicultor primus TaxID=1797195 RepID=A0A1F2UVR0_9ACTN|nr:MAG: hypothetical protein A2074_01450 [Candidatus Aquicultor primus]
MKDASSKHSKAKEVKNMKKILIIMMAFALLLAMGSMALAKQDPAGGPGNIVPNEVTPVGHAGAVKDYRYWEEGTVAASGSYTGAIPAGIYASSTHFYGTWNSPYTAGVDGYNYNDAQDYVAAGDQVFNGTTMLYQSGPHGGYLTSTHRCRECHAVHRAAGKFKLLRSDTRFEACDWCHGTGAGSGYNIQMDNDDDYTTEYNVGHTMGFGVSTGKWRAPDDTYPAYKPNYWFGGFSCFDCHSPHANPARMLGYKDSGLAGGVLRPDGKYYAIANPGHDNIQFATDAFGANTGRAYMTLDKPIYLAGSWLLIKNPDREIATDTETVKYYDIDTLNLLTITINKGQEISDKIYSDTDVNGDATSGLLGQYAANMGWTVALSDENSLTAKFPVNKMPIDWDSPVGAAGTGAVNPGFDERGGTAIWSVNEFCTDCHDGNAGQHTVQAPLFSEDRALRLQSSPNGGSYDLAYGHDVQPRH